MVNLDTLIKWKEELEGQEGFRKIVYIGTLEGADYFIVHKSPFRVYMVDSSLGENIIVLHGIFISGFLKEVEGQIVLKFPIFLSIGNFFDALLKGGSFNVLAEIKLESISVMKLEAIVESDVKKNDSDDAEIIIEEQAVSSISNDEDNI